ncbi:MAG: hypothetical protein IPI50_07075 [Saprospiraceae bacterium]|nr:hypothetical protein [Saprospiraceae bacterium]
MSDPLKNYIQKHKVLLDQNVPPADLFGKIMENEKPKASHKLSFRIVYLAVAMLSGAGLFYCWTLFYPSNLIVDEVPVAVNKEHKKEVLEPIKIPVQENLSTEENFSEQIVTTATDKKSLNLNKPSKRLVLAASEPKTKMEEQKLENKLQIVPIEEVAVIENPKSDKLVEAVLVEPQISEKDLMQDVAVVQNVVPENGSRVIDIDRSNIGSTVKKGIIGWLAKKTDQWTDSKITIQSKIDEDKTMIALNVNTDHVKLHKTMSLP